MDKAQRIATRRALLFDIPKQKPLLDFTPLMALVTLFSSYGVHKALESGTPLNSLYALIPENRREALDRFVRCFGLSPAKLHEALERERS